MMATFLPAACTASDSEWTLVRNGHFEVYSQAGERDARVTLGRFEQLRAFFMEAAVVPSGTGAEQHGPLRIIRFRSVKDYAPFRLRPSADAYYVGSETGDYIVMPRLDYADFEIAAHEYAHLVLRSRGLRLPLWFAEGLAEFFSSLSITDQECRVGGDLPARSSLLRQRRWIPLEQLLQQRAIPVDRQNAAMFYAESWALTSMLITDPRYAPHFRDLAAALASPEAGTLSHFFQKTVNEIAIDLRAWASRPKTAFSLPGIPKVNQPAEVTEVSHFESRLILADLLFASNDLDRSEREYFALEKERPEDPRIAAALGSIALRRGDRDRAREQWKRAMQFGTPDATLCYRYAILAEDAGLPADEIATALERAVELNPTFDDARYKLGLLESNRGHYEAALRQFRAMRPVAPNRAYAYWLAVASALTETDQREEAKQAAAKAIRYAADDQERRFASQLAYTAETDLTVQFSRDATGKLQLVTARKPHASSEWNPFIEPGDRIISIEGQLRKVECKSGTITGFVVQGAPAAVKVLLPDPAHVLISGGTPEFVCGAEDGRRVRIQYAASEQGGAADGVLRGMQFR